MSREIVKSGVLGKVNMVRMENNRNNPEGAWVYPVPPDATPQTIDWQRFLGPAPKRAYDPKVFFRWRCWWEYSGGVATDLFVHMLSQMHEFMDVTGPKSVVSNGGIYRFDDGRTVPDVMNSVYLVSPTTGKPSLLAWMAIQPAFEATTLSTETLLLKIA